MAYLTIAEAVERHGKSESTFRRLIRDVRKSADPAKRRLLKPAEREIEELRASGTSYTYTLAEELIEQELFGKRPKQGIDPRPDTTSNSHIEQLVSKLEARHEREVTRLEKQLEREQQEKMELLKLAQEDKRLFARAADSLGQVLRMPAVAQAVGDAQQSRPITVHTEQHRAAENSTDKSSNQQSDRKDRQQDATSTQSGKSLRRLFGGFRRDR